MAIESVEQTARVPLGAAPAGAEEAAGPVPSAPLSNVAWTVLLSLVVLGAVGFVTFDPSAFGAFARRLSPWWLAAALGTVLLRVGFGAWRLHHFSGGQLGLRGSLRSQVVWDFFACVTPSAIGGGPFVTVFVARDGQLPLGAATAVVLFSMLVDQICFALTIPALLVCARYVEVFPRALGDVGYWSLMLFFCGYLAWVLAFAYGTLVRPRHLVRLVGRVFGLPGLRRWRSRALRAMEGMEGRSRVLRAQPLGFYVKGFVLSLVPWLNRYLLSLFIILSVYPGVDALLVFLRAAALNVGALALPTPGGAGGVEGLYVLFLGPPLVPAPLVAPTLLVWRLLSFYLFIAAGSLIVMHRLRRKARPTAAPFVPDALDRITP